MWVVPDENFTQNQGVEDWAGFGRSVDNNCLNNNKFTPLLNMRLFQWKELWVMQDDKSTQKQAVEDWTGLGAIMNVSKTRNGNLSKV